MPIEVATKVRAFEQEEFHALDRQVMGVVFAVHNQLGRLLDEKLYKRAIAQRCVQMGLGPVEVELPIRVRHEGFSKDYFVDLFLQGGVLLEAKATETLTAGHRAQALNYLLLAGIQHGRLINLRPHRVQYEFVSTSLEPAQRKRFVVVDAEWREPNAVSRSLKQKFIELLQDWGAFLEVNLYRDAILDLVIGSASPVTEVEIRDGSHVLGRQRIALLAPDTMFRCTAMTQGIEPMGEHLRRLLALTPLHYLQWINLNHGRIEFRTLSNPSKLTAADMGLLQKSFRHDPASHDSAK